MTRLSWILAVLLLGGAALDGGAELERLLVDRQTTEVRVSWTMRSEEGVAHYVLKRKAPYQREFQRLEQITQLNGPGHEYIYVDTDLYKGADEEVHYRLEAHYRNGADMDFWEGSTTYQPTAVRRTWGSIKAMFQ